MRGWIEVPPPIRTSTPFTCLPSTSLTLGMKPTSWMPVIARSASRRREGRLHLAGHQLGGRVADEVAGVGRRVGGDVEGLVVRHAGPGVAGDVADRVAAALAGGESGLADLPDELGRVGEGDVVDLDVLAGGDVALVERRELLDRVGEGLHLLGADASEGKLHADHLHVGLALAVDALLQAEADELLLGLLAAQEAGGLGVEVVELPLEDRDHVAGDVVVDLGVLQRPDLALAVLLLARVLLEGRGVRELLGGRRLAVGGGGSPSSQGSRRAPWKPAFLSST